MCCSDVHLGGLNIKRRGWPGHERQLGVIE
jgi:hypothetical protein